MNPVLRAFVCASTSWGSLPHGRANSRQCSPGIWGGGEGRSGEGRRGRGTGREGEGEEWGGEERKRSGGWRREACDLTQLRNLRAFAAAAVQSAKPKGQCTQEGTWGHKVKSVISQFS